MTITAQKLAPAPVWNIDPSHSSATFSIRHLMISKVRGEFGSLEGQVTLDPERPEEATVAASIDVASINTREEKRDAHLKSADFFDVAQFPKIRFASRAIRRDGDDLKLDGELTIRDVTRPVTLTVEGRGWTAARRSIRPGCRPSGWCRRGAGRSSA